MAQQPTRVILELLRKGDIDLCFCTDFGDLEDTNMFERVIILIEDLYILVNKEHPFASRKEVSLYELKDENFIFFNYDTYFKKPALKFFDMVGYKPNIVYEANEDTTVAAFVAAGLGIALIPPIIGIDRSKTASLKITYPVCQRKLCMAWRKNSYMPPIVEKFREFVIKWMPENKKYDSNNY